MDKDGLFHKHQSGFCPNVSTDSCLVQRKDFILTGMDKVLQTGMILVEKQKVWQDHTVSLQIMACISFKESVIKWFQWCISNKKLFVTLEDVFSDAALIK